jgi:hypothetical protein
MEPDLKLFYSLVHSMTSCQLDKVDGGVVDFFVPAAERLLTSDQPARVLAAALASMSGFRLECSSEPSSLQLNIIWWTRGPLPQIFLPPN